MTTRAIASRRSFIQTAGAALSVPLAAAASVPDATAGTDPAEARLGRLEDLEAIRALNQAHALYVNAGDREALAGLFADPSHAEVDAGVREMAPDGFGAQDVVEIAPDRRTATARLHCTLHLETAIGPDCPLVEMARQQGGGVVRRSERVVVENTYVRRDGVWKFERSAHRARAGV